MAMGGDFSFSPIGGSLFCFYLFFPIVLFCFVLFRLLSLLVKDGDRMAYQCNCLKKGGEERKKEMLLFLSCG